MQKEKTLRSSDHLTVWLFAVVIPEVGSQGDKLSQNKGPALGRKA